MDFKKAMEYSRQLTGPDFKASNRRILAAHFQCASASTISCRPYSKASTICWVDSIVHKMKHPTNKTITLIKAQFFFQPGAIVTQRHLQNCGTKSDPRAIKNPFAENLVVRRL